MNQKLFAVLIVVLAIGTAAYGQTVTVYDPTRTLPDETFAPAIEEVVAQAATAASRSIPAATCEREAQIAGKADGAFTRAGAKQTLVFYQYCQTGNGFGWAGLVLLEGGKLAGNFISEGGWTNGISRVADVNRNGVDEFVLAYSGGMHQGQGGTGVDLMEFTAGRPVAIGWYKAEEYTADENSTAWVLTAKPGSSPVFYTQKLLSAGNNKYRAAGRAAAAKLRKAVSKFTTVK